MRPVNWRLMLGAVVLLALGVVAFGSKAWQAFTGSEEITVAVAAVKQESRPVVLRMSGELQPFAEVDVFSRLAGRLTEVKFKTGDTVNAGAVVASVQSGETAERARLVEIELNANTKQLQEREQQAVEADKQLSRNRELYRQDLIARRDVEQAETQAATARAQLELARAQIAQGEAMLTQARKLQQLARIVAPMSGVVTGTLSAGAPVNEARAILTIAQIDSLKLVAEVPSRFNEFIRDGMTAPVSSRHGSLGERPGKVVRLNGKAKASAEETQLEITVDNRDHALAVGTVVDAALTLAQREQVLTIPRSALLGLAGKHYVWQISDGRAAQRAVTIDDPATDPVTVRDGLKLADQVIVERVREIKAGVRVRPVASAR